MKIAILTPTRGRPYGLLRLYESLAATISGKHQFIFVYYVDSDDEKLSEYEQLIFTEHDNIEIMYYRGPRMIIAQTFNYMASQLKDDDLYFMNGADDMVFDTMAWDDILSTRILNHAYGLYYFDDGIQHEGMATFAIVSQHWIKKIGYFFPEHIMHNFIDTYIHDVAKRAGTLVYIPEVKLIHHHFTLNSALLDKTYQDAEQYWGHDLEAFETSVEKRMQEAELIKSLIQ
jgi:hypothetical protein